VAAAPAPTQKLSGMALVLSKLKSSAAAKLKASIAQQNKGKGQKNNNLLKILDKKSAPVKETPKAVE